MLMLRGFGVSKGGELAPPTPTTTGKRTVHTFPVTTQPAPARPAAVNGVAIGACSTDGEYIFDWNASAGAFWRRRSTTDPVCPIDHRGGTPVGPSDTRPTQGGGVAPAPDLFQLLPAPPPSSNSMKSCWDGSQIPVDNSCPAMPGDDTPPSAGTNATVTNTAAALLPGFSFAAVPTWVWLLGGGGMLVGLTALVTRSRRRAAVE